MSLNNPLSGGNDANIPLGGGAGNIPLGGGAAAASGAPGANINIGDPASQANNVAEGGASNLLNLPLPNQAAEESKERQQQLSANPMTDWNP